MDNETSEKKQLLRRVVLTPAASDILRNWKEQLANLFPGFEVSERNLIEWSLSESAMLTRHQLHDLRSRFFDEVKHLEAVIHQLQLAASEEERSEIRRSLVALIGPKTPPRVPKNDTEKPATE